MAVGCNALNSTQLVAGCDFHKQMPPPPPAGPLPMAPHPVVYCMGFAMPATAKQSTTVKAGSGYALGRQHDLGAGMYHFAPNILLPLIWAGAGNKAEFGSSSVFIGVNGQAQRMAVALIPGAGLNLQLDCNEPCAMPTSVCIASFNTVTAGFTVADCIAGFAAMAADIAVTWLSAKIVGGVGKMAGAGIAAVLGRSALGIQTMLAVGVVASAFPTTTAYVGAVANLLGGWVAGSPLGYSPDWALINNVYPSEANNAINDWISPTPTLPNTPPSSLPPTSPQTRKTR
jgi:hypothetical protein